MKLLPEDFSSKLIAIACVASIASLFFVPSCSKPAPPKQPPISQKVRVENLHARVEKSYRLSETESIKIVIVPGWPFGERCVIYSNAVSSTMQCREITTSQQ